MKKTIKIPWLEFVSYAMDTVQSKYPGAANPKFMVSLGVEPDMENYEGNDPHYVEIELP